MITAVISVAIIAHTNTNVVNRKPEAQFVSSVHKHFTKVKWHQSMYTPYSAGTPDHYYLGNTKSLWVEWKFYQKFPKKFYSFEKLSKQQNLWVQRAKSVENVWVGLGCPDGGIFSLENELLIDVQPLDRKTLAHQIERFINGN